METHNSSFDEHSVLHKLKHYLPAQAPLKDFIHHNTLHAFQKLKFFEGLRNASEIFGYKVSLSLAEYRSLYAKKQISDAVLEKVIRDAKGDAAVDEWKINLDRPTTKFYVSPGWLNGDEGDKYVFRTDSSDEFAYIYYYYNF